MSALRRLAGASSRSSPTPREAPPEPPVKGGLAPRIANLAEWRSHLLARLRRQIEVTADPLLEDLLSELCGYPAPAEGAGVGNGDNVQYAGVAVPFRLVTEHGVLSFISATTIFGTPVDVTLSELALESFFPADAATASALRGL